MHAYRPFIGFARTAARATVYTLLVLVAVGTFAAMALDIAGVPSFSWTIGPIPFVAYRSGAEGNWGVQFGTGVFLLSLCIGLVSAGVAARRQA